MFGNGVWLFEVQSVREDLFGSRFEHHFDFDVEPTPRNPVDLEGGLRHFSHGVPVGLVESEPDLAHVSLEASLPKPNEHSVFVPLTKPRVLLEPFFVCDFLVRVSNL